ncbi:hypothetical protein [Pseudonocardia sp.]|uniref:hypothetical protein n=1 Tax=Pseudonocardia sp. TaxID=60912 RepID=UPI003D10A12B
MNRPDVHRDPDEIRAAAAAVARVLDELRPLLAVRPSPCEGPVAAAGQEQVRVVAGHVVAELELLEAVARHCAGAAVADHDAARSMRMLDQP